MRIEEVFEIVEGRKENLVKLIYDAIAKIPDIRDCPCKYALLGAEIDKV